MKIILFEEVIETNEFFLIPFNNYPKGRHKKHKFLNAYDNEFNFSETKIYDRYHTSVTPGFISSIERHPKCELWKIGIKYIYAKDNGEIHTKFINCLISNKIKEDYQVKVGDLLIKPGDLIVGDTDGITRVPIEIAEETLKCCKKVRDYETGVFDELKKKL